MKALLHFRQEVRICLLSHISLYVLAEALTDGVLRGAGDVVVFTLANLCNLAVRVSIAFICAPLWGVRQCGMRFRLDG